MGCVIMNPKINALQEHNMLVFLAKGPRLTTEYSTWIEYKDTKNKRVLIGGLGACGVGRMWFPMEEKYRDRPDYIEAPEMDSTGQFGTE